VFKRQLTELFLYSFWCFVWEAAEWLKTIFPAAVDDIEYVRVTWAGGRPYDEVLAERWTNCELMRAYADNVFARGLLVDGHFEDRRWTIEERRHSVVQATCENGQSLCRED
jgi:hypothetical protein